MRVDTSPLGLVVEPFTLINFTFDVSENALSVSLSHHPQSFIDSSIAPCHGTFAISESSDPFSIILGLRSIGVHVVQTLLRLLSLLYSKEVVRIEI